MRKLHRDLARIGDYFEYDNRICKILDIFHGRWTGMKTFGVLIDSWDKTHVHEKYTYWADLPELLTVPRLCDLKEFIKKEKSWLTKKT